MNCKIDPESLVCVRCGASVSAAGVQRNCAPGLGDRLAAGLAAVGITKERVAAAVGDCGCEERQRSLNRLGHRLGIGVVRDVDR